MKKININTFLLLACLFALIYSIFQIKSIGISQLISNSDTTIVINNSFDTNIYNMTVSNIHKPVEIYRINDDQEDPNLCDSIRVYKPGIENDSIAIFNKLFVQGKLLNYDISYKWKLPVKSEIIRTITNDIIKPQHGIFGGMNISYKNNISKIPLGLQIGYFSKMGNIFSYSYDLDKTHSLFIGKSIDISRRKIGKFRNVDN